MWTLIILYFTLNGQSSTAVVDGFPSDLSCLTAGHAVLKSVEQQMKDYKASDNRHVYGTTLIAARVVCVNKGEAR